MPDPKVEIVGIRELRLGEVLTMSYPGQPVLGTKQVVPMFLETMDPKTGEKVELKLALSMEQLAELQARAAKASTGTEYIGRLQFFGPLRVGDSGLSTNIYKPHIKGFAVTPLQGSDLMHGPHPGLTPWAMLCRSSPNGAVENSQGSKAPGLVDRP